MIRRGGITDILWFLARLEIKCLISIQHFTPVVIMAQLRVLASHKTNFEYVKEPRNYTCSNLGGAIF